MKWSETDFQTLYTVPSRNGIYKTKMFHGSGCRIVNMGELFGLDFISNQDMKRIELSEAELSTNALKDGDLLFGRRSLVEAGAGKCSIVFDPGEPLTFESSIIRVRLDKQIANAKFYYYYFRSPQGRGLIGSIVSGTNVKGIRGTDLKKLRIVYPEKSIQDKIVEFLFPYDDLIENNRRRMALLEESARLLFQEWFVRLRFPGHEHTRIVDGVPEGWRPKVLGDLCTEVRETVLPEKLEPDTPYIGLEHMPRRSIALSEWGKSYQVMSTKHRFREGEILFAKIRPYFHKVGLAFVEGVASSDAIILQPLFDHLRGLVLMTVSSDPFIAEAAQTMREGSKMPRADWKLMRQYIVAVPPDGLLKTFNETISDITGQLKVLTFQNQKLRQARDLLLPRLMSGEIAV